MNGKIEEARKIFITAHENPDPDAVGSVLAFHHFLRAQGKETLCYLPTPAPARLNFLPGFFDIRTSFSSPPAPLDSWAGDKGFDVFLCLDYGDFKRLRLPEGVKEEKIITIDHHLESDQRGRIKIIDSKVSSTAELIYLWIKSSFPDSSPGEFLTKEMAVCLLTGIISDSGGFSHVSTSSQTFKIASCLIFAGAPLNEIFQKVYTVNNLQFIRQAWGKVLSRIDREERSGLVYSWLSYEDIAECQANLSDLAQISSFLSTIPEARLSLFLVEPEKGRVEASLRSEPYKNYQVAALAEALGGGGHAYAAGFRQDGTIESVLKKVLELLE